MSLPADEPLPTETPEVGQHAQDTSLARRQFLGLDEDDAQRIRRLLPLLAQMRPQFVNDFYNHLLAFEETAAFLHDPVLVERLKVTQGDHLESLLQANWDATYVESRKRVGQRHAETGVVPHFFLAAYYQYVQASVRFLHEHGNMPVEEAMTSALSLLKAIFFDIGLTLDAYFDHLTEDLRSALELYWRTNNDLRQFARLASHDLKTPLATVANLCEEALDEFGMQMPPEARELIHAAHSRTLKMSSVIDELLRTSSETNAPDTLDEFPSGEALREAVERIEPQLQAANIELILPLNCPYVYGNRVRLREAFFNLLSNAAKFTDQKPGRIEVTVLTKAKRAVFCFADSGPGIAPGDVDKIFAPFRRLQQHRAKPGSGLGLYFAKMLIEAQGGRIWLESELGVGSKFFVELPREPIAPPPRPLSVRW